MSDKNPYGEWLDAVMAECGIDDRVLAEEYAQTNPRIRNIRGRRRAVTASDIRRYREGSGNPEPITAYCIGRALLNLRAKPFLEGLGTISGFTSAARAAASIPRYSEELDPLDTVLWDIKGSISAAIGKRFIEPEVSERWDEAYEAWLLNNKNPVLADGNAVPDHWIALFRILKTVNVARKKLPANRNRSI